MSRVRLSTVSGLRKNLEEKILPLKLQSPERFLNQAKNCESSQTVMSNRQRENGFRELSEPVDKFDSNYPVAAASRPYHSTYSGSFEQKAGKTNHHTVNPRQSKINFQSTRQ